MAKEAKARIKINKMLEDSGWRFFDDATGKANIILEPRVKLTKALIDAFGDIFEDTTNGFIDFLLLDEAGFPPVSYTHLDVYKRQLPAREEALGVDPHHVGLDTGRTARIGQHLAAIRLLPAHGGFPHQLDDFAGVADAGHKSASVV